MDKLTEVESAEELVIRGPFEGRKYATYVYFCGLIGWTFFVGTQTILKYGLAFWYRSSDDGLKVLEQAHLTLFALLLVLAIMWLCKPIAMSMLLKRNDFDSKRILVLSIDGVLVRRVGQPDFYLSWSAISAVYSKENWTFVRPDWYLIPIGIPNSAFENESKRAEFVETVSKWIRIANSKPKPHTQGFR